MGTLFLYRFKFESLVSVKMKLLYQMRCLLVYDLFGFPLAGVRIVLIVTSKAYEVARTSQ